MSIKLELNHKVVKPEKSDSRFLEVNCMYVFSYNVQTFESFRMS